MHSVLERQKLSALLQKAYFRQLSAEEIQLLSVWRKQSPENEILYQRVCRGETVADMLDWKEGFDANKVAGAIQNRIGSRRHARIRKVFRRVAAILILGLGMGAMFYFSRFREQEPQGVWTVSQIQPGSAKAILTLGNGRQVALDKYPIKLNISGKEVVTGDSAILNYTGNLSVNNEEAFEEAELPEQNVVDVPAGGEYQLILPDGTRVWLNSASSLKFPVEFVGEQRLVVLQGEAYFEVAPDATKPFIVETSMGMEIKVTGTHFNVEAYADRKEWKTTLVEGSVEVSLGKDQVHLHPNEQYCFDSETNQGKLKEVNVREAIAWKNGWFVFDNTPLEEIMETIRRWYDIGVEYQDDAMKQLRFTGDLSKYDGFEAVIRMFQDTRKVKIKVDANRLTIGKQ